MLHLHRGDRADALVQPLAEIIASPAADPFEREVVAVPTRGVERWLAQRLAHHLGAGPDGEGGVCADVDFDSPARMVAAVLAAVLGVRVEDDPWHVDRLTWSVLDLLDDSAGTAWGLAVARHLGTDTRPADEDDHRRGRRLGVAQHLATLFATYASQRPGMVRAWSDGRDDDGTGEPVPGDLAWQPELWRALRARIGSPGPAERLGTALAHIASRPETLALPERISVFGPTRLPEDQLGVLRALSEARDVHLWLPHPSRALWDAVSARSPGGEAGRRGRGPAPARHPFLASMSRDVVEMQERLLALGGAVTTHHPAPDPPTTMLGALQRALRADETGPAPGPLDASDGTVQVHACYGTTRQVEVLREVLAGLFARDPSLEPRDVLVMAPAVEVVAPLVAAAFGTGPLDEGPVHPGRTFRVSIADTSPRFANPLLPLLARLLDVADGRVTLSEVLDLAAAPPVRRRFRLSDDDLTRITGWATQAGVRWGEDLGRRARFGLSAVGQGTWRAGLDRILLGVAMAEEDQRFLRSALPLDDVGSTEIDLVGRLAELLDRLGTVLAALCGVHPLEHWLGALERALETLTEVAPEDAWQLVQARETLADLRRAGPAPSSGHLRLGDARSLLAHRLAGRPTRTGFRTGALTVCSLEPMRSVPHRVVCLLGLDDGAFPRGGGTDGDNLLLRGPLVGEQDRRSEDRQIVLDAVCAARETLVVLYSGADERTGAGRPPAVPVAELLDALDALGAPPATRQDAAFEARSGLAAARRRVVRRHPLLDVDERNFVDGALGTPGPFSFDAVAHRAALAARSRREPGPFLPYPLPRVAGLGAGGPAEPGAIDLADVIAVLEHPVRAFVRRRLGVLLPGDETLPDDHLPLTLDGLQTWAVGERLLAAQMAGVDPASAFEVERRRGEVPPRALGRALLESIDEDASLIARAAAAHALGEATALDLRVALPGGLSVTGSVPDVHGDVVVRATYSRLAAKHRLRAWVQLLALAAAFPARPWRAATVGRPASSVKVPMAVCSVITAPPGPEAARHLAGLVGLAARALDAPLPLPAAVACAYASGRAGGTPEQALDDARRAWTKFDGPEDAYHRLVWGEASSFDELPLDGVLEGVALPVWQPLLAHEQTETSR